MAIVQEMLAVAAECIERPGRTSIWSERLEKFVCSDDPIFQEVVAEQSRKAVPNHPAINPTFKLVFLTASGGTLLFVVICITATILAGKDAPTPLERLIAGMFDLAKIGFGAVVGLLGSQTLRGRQDDVMRSDRRGT